METCKPILLSCFIDEAVYCSETWKSFAQGNSPIKGQNQHWNRESYFPHQSETPLLTSQRLQPKLTSVSPTYFYPGWSMLFPHEESGSSPDPMCELPALTLGYSKTLATKPHGGRLPTPHQTWGTTNQLQFSAGNCCKGFAFQPITPLTNHIHGHIYIPGLGASIQRPHYWGPWWRYFSALWLRTFPLLSLPTPWVHKKVEAFVGVLFRSRMIPPVLHPLDSHPVLFYGGKWNTGKLEAHFTSLLQWLKAWLLLLV